MFFLGNTLLQSKPNAITCNGQSVLKYHKTNQSNINQYFIGCSSYTFGTRHRYIRGKPNVDEDLLKELLTNEGQVNDNVKVIWFFYKIYWFYHKTY